MKTGLDHLPAQKQRELDHVLRVIFEEFKAAHADAKSHRRRGKVVKIILYGSHARGGWVDEPHTAKGYVSDFDLLIIVSGKEIADRQTHWQDADERLIEEQLAGRLRTPVNFIVHSLQEVNNALAHGRFFFMDIVRDGIVLYETLRLRGSRNSTRPCHWRGSMPALPQPLVRRLSIAPPAR